MAALMRWGLSALRVRSFAQTIVRLKSVHISALDLSTRNGLRSTLFTRLMATSVSTKEKLLQTVHRKIDYNIGVGTQQFESLATSLEEHGALSEQDVGLLLHICGSGPFDCPTCKRLQYLDEIWSKLEKHNISPTTKLYNIKLKAYCRNKKDFNVLDELMQMKSLGLNPDKITYSLLIEGFCLKGDIEGANSVLTAMKTANLPANVNIFNSFIAGHLKAGSPEEASNILELISSSGLNPNSETYFKFASFYAEKGDTDSVIKYLNEAEELGIQLDQSRLLDLHMIMVTSGHSSAAAQLLQVITEKSVFTSSFMQKSCHLIAEGFVDAAVELYVMMPKLEDEKMVPNSGNFLLKSMILNGHSSQEIFDVADKVVEICPRSFPHKNGLVFAYRAKRTDLAMDLLELMISKNHTIKYSYIVPAICGYQREKNIEGIYKATHLLLKIQNAGSRDDKLDHLIKCSYPALKNCEQSRENIVERFKHYEKLWNSVFLLEDLDTKGYKVALENAEGKELDGAPFQWADGPRKFTKFLSEEIDTCIEVLDFIHEQPGVKQDSFGYLTSKLVRFFINQKNWSGLEQLLDGLLEKKLFLVQSLKQISALNEAPSGIKQKLDQLCEGSGTSSGKKRGKKLLPLDQLLKLSEEELRMYQKKYPDRHLPRLALLINFMDANDLESMKQSLREFQVLGFNFSLIQTMRIISKLTKLKETEMALFYFDELKKMRGDSYKTTIPLLIGQELVKQGNVEGALETITAAKKSQCSESLKVTIKKKRLLADMIENAPTLEDAAKLHTAMFQPEPIFTGSDATLLHGSYMKKVSAVNDDTELVNTLVSIYQKYRSFPHSDLILQKLILSKDVANLKKVMDIGNAAFGSNVFHHKLAISFIRCGMPAKGVTILKTSGLKMNEKVINASCRQLIRLKEIDKLESLVNVMKDMPVSQANMLSQLVEGYVSVGNLKQATEAVQQFAMDYKQPPRNTIEFLLRAFESSNEEAPEVLLSLSSKFDQRSTESKSDVSSSDSGMPSQDGPESPDSKDKIPES